MTLPSMLLFAAALGVACASPGPTTTALVARVLARGPAGAPMFCLGLLVGDLIWLLGAALGVAVLATRFEPAFQLIKFAGVAYLLYLAWKLWTSAAASSQAPGAIEPAGARLLLTGLSIALGNPKTMLFYVALLPSLMSLANLAAFDLLVLVAIVSVVYGGVLATYVLLAIRVRRFLRSPRAVRLVNRTSGAVMAGAAAVIALR